MTTKFLNSVNTLVGGERDLGRLESISALLEGLRVDSRDRERHLVHDRKAVCDDGPGNRKIRAIHPAQVPPAAFFRMHNLRPMAALGIEGGGERQNMRRTKLHAKATGFTSAFYDNRNTSFCHERPQVGVTITPMFHCGGCDLDSVCEAVVVVTEYREGKHQLRCRGRDLTD